MIGYILHYEGYQGMKISGHVDLCGPDLIEGWLYSDLWDDTSIKLQVYVGADLLGECTVDRFRADLQQAGFGDGRCGFSFKVPEVSDALDFARTRLRFVDSPVYLLPDDHTVFGNERAVPIQAPTELPSGGHEVVNSDVDETVRPSGRGNLAFSRRALAT